MLFLTIVTQCVAERGAAGALPVMAALIGSPLSRYQPMAVSRWLLMASAATFSAPTWATALAITVSEAVTSASPDCSTQPSRGVWIASGCENLTITLPRLSSTTALALVVPSSGQ
nr:Uncharacterised protein [Klebsiella pneumoniae]